jgi:MerR family mercuric resistance operon transcriptional regulator
MRLDHMNERPMRRSDLAEATGCNLETIRYYESVDLLPAPARTAAGHRVYTDQDVRRLKFVMRSRELGFSLEDIRGLLGLGDGALHTCAEVRDRTEVHLADVRARIADLQRIEAVLSRTAALCTGQDRPDCAVLDSLRH